MSSTRSLTGATTVQFLTEEEKSYLRRCSTLVSEINECLWKPFRRGIITALLGWIAILTYSLITKSFQPTSALATKSTNLMELLRIFILLIMVFLSSAAVGALLYFLFYRGRRNQKIKELDKLQNNQYAFSALKKLREYGLIRDQFNEFA